MSESVTTVRVQLSERSYDIEIGTGNLDRAGEFLSSCVAASHVVIVTDRNVKNPHANHVCRSLTESGKRVDVVVVDPGEGTKSVAQAEALWQALLTRATDRRSVVVAVGGGVVGDLAGFIAATYARGIDWVQVPTSLLAQVDSSVGGKVAVNMPGAKNMIGAFWQPRGVLMDTLVLNTLPLREYRAGLGEVVKYGVILDEAFFSYLEGHVDAIQQREPEVLRSILARCCRLKADVVEADEREESGLRSVLNYGHTFCHAIEALAGYGVYLHGEAVAMGMLCASRLAERLGRIDAQITQRQHDLLVALGLPVDVPDLDRDRFLAAMQRDKKVAHGRLRFVLPSRMGHVELVGDVPDADVQAALEN
ncbi:MAG: 3-dehydroquinate synthase [Pirellulaceae bacterium]